MMRIPRFVLDRIIRRKCKLAETPLDRFAVRIARTVEEHRDAFRLVQVAYQFQGIESLDERTEMRMTPQHVLPESTVLVAYEGERIVGTLTVTLDSPAGLPLDKDYPEELDALRRREARIVEYGSYAVVRRCWHSGVTHLLCMAAYHFARYSLAGTHCVVGVHPRALPLYRAVYNFGPLGEVKEHAELAAPVQGLVQDMAAVQPFFKRRFRKPMSSGLKVWEHFIDVLPRCVQVPAFRSLDELVRWKLPRTVFQELFIERSDRLATIDGRVRSQLEGWRSIHTVQPARRPRVRPALRVVKGGQTERYTALGAS